MSESDVKTMLIHGANPAHVPIFKTGIKSVYEYLMNMEESGSQKVVIIGGSHFPNLFRKSRVYAGCLERALIQAGYNVTMRLDGGDPDHDFYFMSHAKKIIIAAGW